MKRKIIHSPTRNTGLIGCLWRVSAEVGRQYVSYPLTQRISGIILILTINPYHEHVITSMSKSLLEAIDDFRCSNRLPTGSEAIRRLIELRLEVAKAKHGRPA